MTPKVIQEVPIHLEKDLLAGPSVRYNMQVTTMGQVVEDYTFSEDGTTTDGYTVEWD